MSSPPRVDFPTSEIDDIEMDGPPQEGTIGQSLSIAPPPQRLFLPGTPSAAGTPARQRYANSVAATPMSGVTARRALGMSTPRRAPQTPLFVRKCLLYVRFNAIHLSC
jgi:DNA replication licensing factor MCM4